MSVLLKWPDIPVCLNKSDPVDRVSLTAKLAVLASPISCTTSILHSTWSSRLDTISLCLC